MRASILTKASKRGKLTVSSVSVAYHVWLIFAAGECGSTRPLFSFYAQPNSRAVCATMKQTAKAIASGSSAATAVHFLLLVSL